MLQPSSKRISPSVRLQILQAEQNFDHLALLRVDEIKRSAPYCADGALGGARVSSGFSAFALRSLVLVAAHASNHVVKMLISWHERERTRAAAVNDVRDCAVNATFCEALLAVLLGHPDAASGATDGAAGSTTTAAPRGAPCEPIVLDVLLERAFEFFLMQKEKRQEVARRRLAALNGRTEEELWRAVLHALSRHRFESLSNKLLVQLEAAGGGGGGRRRGGVGKGVEAMCCALRGLHVPSGAGGADADTTGAGVKEAYSFLHSLWNRVLQSKQYRPIHPAVCDALGTALLGDALREATLQPADPAAVSTAELDVTLASPRPFAAAASDYGFRQSDGASLHAELLGELQKEVAKWALGKIGADLARPFVCWSAPLATALVCRAHATSPRGPDVLAERARLEDIHRALLKKLLSCLSRAHAQRIGALRCLEVLLPCRRHHHLHMLHHLPLPTSPATGAAPRAAAAAHAARPRPRS